MKEKIPFVSGLPGRDSDEFRDGRKSASVDEAISRLAALRANKKYPAASEEEVRSAREREARMLGEKLDD